MGQRAGSISWNVGEHNEHINTSNMQQGVARTSRHGGSSLERVAVNSCAEMGCAEAQIK